MGPLRAVGSVKAVGSVRADVALKAVRSWWAVVFVRSFRATGAVRDVGVLKPPRPG